MIQKMSILTLVFVFSSQLMAGMCDSTQEVFKKANSDEKITLNLVQECQSEDAASVACVYSDEQKQVYSLGGIISGLSLYAEDLIYRSFKDEKNNFYAEIRSERGFDNRSISFALDKSSGVAQIKYEFFGLEPGQGIVDRRMAAKILCK